MDDRISSLPNEILCHILSFLPTEDVYATSVLSKRWMPLCLSVPTLDYDDQRFVATGKSYSNFMMMIYATLFRQISVHKYIKKICIKCETVTFNESVEHSLLEKSLTSMVEHGMEHLDLKHSPCFIFSFRTLVVLKLKDISFIDFSITVDLTSLKILYLFNVHFKERSYLAELLNGCPILEELSNLVRANISNKGCLFDIPPLHALCNIEFLFLEEVFRGILPIFSNLTHLELIFVREEADWYVIDQILQNCPKLQNFLLDKPDCLRSFKTLWYHAFLVHKCSSSQLRKCTIKNCDRYDLGFVKHIMQQKSASLRFMTLYTPPSLDPLQKLEMKNELLSSVESSSSCKIIFN